MAKNPGAFEIKQCFHQVQFNGKSKWDPPLEKDNSQLFVLGEEPSGSLKFNFTLNPVALKDAEKQIKKATDEGDLKKADMLRSN